MRTTELFKFKDFYSYYCRKWCLFSLTEKYILDGTGMIFIYRWLILHVSHRDCFKAGIYYKCIIFMVLAIYHGVTALRFANILSFGILSFICFVC